MTDKRIMVKDKYELTIEETSFVEDVRNIISTAKEHTYNTALLSRLEIIGPEKARI